MLTNSQQGRSWVEGEGGLMWPPWPAESKRRENGRQNEYLGIIDFLRPVNFKLLSQIKGKSTNDCDV
jgi:hypothetical protein